MKKIHRAVQTGPNKWEKKTSWHFDVDEIVTVVVVLIIAGSIVARALLR